MAQIKENENEMRVFYTDTGYEKLNQILSGWQYSKVFIFVDENTNELCLPIFLSKLSTATEIEVIEMEQGEENKTIETCSRIWEVLSELGGDRKSLIINLGGGVLTDIGGFIAATYKRGIPFINVPTTLLSMVDAAVGGKTGVNLQGLKNQIGVIEPADIVLIDIDFLTTLPPSQLRSGLAEMLKHGLIKDEAYWKKLLDLENKNMEDMEDLIRESIEIKEEIVKQDPYEQNIRKSLNYGHTLGHAIETFFLEQPSKKKLLHGEAVAAGMIMETYISLLHLDFPKDKLIEITDVLYNLYGKLEIEKEEFEEICSLMKYDKKNEKGNINFVLLKNIGEPVIDCHILPDNLHKAFAYYRDIK